MSVHPTPTAAQSMNYQPADSNAITSRVGSTFAVIPNVFRFKGACCGAPPLPQKIHIVPAPHPIDTPIAAQEIAVNVTKSHAQTSSAIQSYIPQYICCGYCSRGLTANQTFNNDKGEPMFTYELEQPCCKYPRLASFGPNKEPIGHLEFRSTPCSWHLKTACCLAFCRTASFPEFPYVVAVNAKEEEKLSLRRPPVQGKCLLCSCSHFSCSTQEICCCALLPDVPFHKYETIYGSSGTNIHVGSVNVRGAYGYDKACCGMNRKFGIRPEIAIQYQMNQQLPIENVSKPRIAPKQFGTTFPHRIGLTFCSI